MKLLFIILCSIIVASSASELPSQVINEIKQRNLTDVSLSHLLSSTEWNTAIGNLFSNITHVNSSLSISKACLTEILKLAWVFNATIPEIIFSPYGKVMDSWGKPPPRVMIGNINWLGGYDECARIDGFKYCNAKMKFIGLFPGSIGVCFPQQCNYIEVYEVLMGLNPLLKGVITFPPLSTKSYALCEEPLEYDTGLKATISILGILALFCFLGTLLEILQDLFTPSSVQFEENDFQSLTSDKPEGELIKHSNVTTTKPPIMKRGNIITQVMISFSLIKNTRAILASQLPKGGIGSINGIRVISMFWVILGHVYFFGAVSGRVDNSANLIEVLHRFSFMAVGNAFVAVDSFFLLSGLLVAYLTLKRMDSFDSKTMKEKVYFWVLYYVHRFVRLTPSLGVLMLIYTNLLPAIITGPSSTNFRGIAKPSFQHPCTKYWWTNILYINNFYPKEMGDQCVGWVWYLANDMQFYIVSPLILYVVYKLDQRLENHRLRYVVPLLWLLSLCTISFIVIATLTGVHDWPSVPTSAYIPKNPRAAKMGDRQNAIYEKPYTRMPPYLVGLFLGYALTRKIKMRFGYTKLISITGWVIAIVLAMSVVYGPWKMFKPNGGEFFTKTENIFYGTFDRFSWAVAVAWVVYACHMHAGGLVNNFLSWKVWIPLSRLTYGAYLLHPVVLIYFYSIQENPYHYQDNLIIFHIVGVTVLSYAASFLMALFVEYPVLNLEKKIFSS